MSDAIDAHPQHDPAITEATVCYRQTARIGSRVKHYGQRWTGCATATVVGFRDLHGGTHAKPWIKVLVEPDRSSSSYGTEWDWDRTEIAPDIGVPAAPDPRGGAG